MKITFIATLLITAVNLHLATPTRAAEDYVAHEWGTFTSVQGAEGVQLAWNPFITSELAAFVYDPYKQNAEQITGYSTGAAAARPQIVEATRGLDLGRFL